MSEERPWPAESGQVRRAQTGPNGSDSNRRALLLFLGIMVGAVPLAAAVVLRQLLGVPDIAVGAMALLSIAIMAVATSLFRPRARGESAQPSPIQTIVSASEAEPEEPISVDPLTGLLTFQPFSQRLLEEYQLCKAYGACAALVLVDVNHLSQINRQFGTQAGDQVLRLVASSLETTKRASDVTARLGDDEFAALLLECDGTGAIAFIDRLQECLARDSITVQRADRPASIWIGVSAGYAVCSSEAADADEILTAAVESLEQARSERDKRRQRWERSA